MPKMKIYRIPREDGTKVPMPKYSKDGDACFDIYSNNQSNIIIEPHTTAKIPTGLILEPETGYHVKLHNRSSMGSNHDIQLSHCVGVVDGNYRGELLVPLYNRGNRCFVVTPEMRICQGEIKADSIAEFEEVESFDDLSVTDRGSDGFGSTGTN